jgi:hypothetical protein
MDRFLATGIAQIHTFQGRPIDQFDSPSPPAIHPFVNTMRLGLDDGQLNSTERRSAPKCEMQMLQRFRHPNIVRMFSLDPRRWTSLSPVRVCLARISGVHVENRRGSAFHCDVNLLRQYLHYIHDIRDLVVVAPTISTPAAASCCCC